MILMFRAVLTVSTILSIALTRFAVIALPAPLALENLGAFGGQVEAFLAQHKDLTDVINSTVRNQFEYLKFEDRAPDRYIIRLTPEVPDAMIEKINNLLELLGCSVLFKYAKVFRGFAFNWKGELPLDIFRRIPYIASIEQDHYLYRQQVQPLNEQTWGLDRIDQARGRDKQYAFDLTGKGVNVYIVDSGLDAAHSELNGRARVAYVAQALARQGGYDCTGHGTHVAGIVAGTNVGVAKLANIHALRVIGCDDSSSNSEIIAAIEWVTANHERPAVINLSLGPQRQQNGQYPASPAMAASLQETMNSGVIVVAAAGNDATNACSGAPAGVEGVITVAATDRNDNRASFSNYGNCVSIFAPGVDIISAQAGGTYVLKSGTSQAAPFVTGVVALYLERNPGASQMDVMNALRSAAVQRIVGNPLSPNYFLQSISIPAPGSPGYNTNLVNLASPSTIVATSSGNSWLGLTVGQWIIVVAVFGVIVASAAVGMRYIRYRKQQSLQKTQQPKNKLFRIVSMHENSQGGSGSSSPLVPRQQPNRPVLLGIVPAQVISPPMLLNSSYGVQSNAVGSAPILATPGNYYNTASTTAQPPGTIKPIQINRYWEPSVFDRSPTFDQPLPQSPFETNQSPALLSSKSQHVSPVMEPQQAHSKHLRHLMVQRYAEQTTAASPSVPNSPVDDKDLPAPNLSDLPVSVGNILNGQKQRRKKNKHKKHNGSDGSEAAMLPSRTKARRHEHRF